MNVMACMYANAIINLLLCMLIKINVIKNEKSVHANSIRYSQISGFIPKDKKITVAALHRRK